MTIELTERKRTFKVNGDYKFWITINDTTVDSYPELQTDNNDYYLDHNFTGR